MATTQMADKLTDYGNSLVETIKAFGFSAVIDLESYRDWTVKLRVSGGPFKEQETINLYSNGKGKTSYKLHEASVLMRGRLTDLVEAGNLIYAAPVERRPELLALVQKEKTGLSAIAQAAEASQAAPAPTPSHPAGTEMAAELENFCKGLCERLEKKGFKAQLDPLSFKNYSATIELFDGHGEPLRIPIHTNAKQVFHAKYDKVPDDRRERIREQVDNAVANLPDGIVIFVDGSYDKETKRGGYGVRVINSGRIVFDLAGPVQNPEGDNIAGEIRGVLRALDWARKAGAKETQIRHDYKGLHFWIFPDPETGKLWKNNTADGRMYAAKVNEHVAGGLKLQYLKVAAHAGDIHNEAVDKLAKEGVKLDKERIQYYRKPLAIDGPAPNVAAPILAQTQPATMGV